MGSSIWQIDKPIWGMGEPIKRMVQPISRMGEPIVPIDEPFKSYPSFIGTIKIDWDRLFVFEKYISNLNLDPPQRIMYK